MAEYLERNAVRKVLRGSAVGKYPVSFYVGLFAAAEEVEKMPAADVAPVVHGRWVEKINPDRFDFKRNCSVCQKGSDLATDYCPNCGADMREQKDGE